MKKGQFYLLTSIILIVVMYGLIQTGINLKATKTEKNVKDLYELEAKNIINNALYENKDVIFELDSFTKNFIEFNNDKNKLIGLIYLYKDDELHIKNYGLDAIFNNTNLDSITISIDKVTITINDINYDYSFNNERVEFKSLIIENEI